MLSAEDRLEIQDLLLTYSTVQQRSERTLLDIFTEDVVLEGPRGYWEGHDGVRGFLAQHERAERTEFERGPLITNIRVRGSGDNATMTAWFLQVKGQPGADRAIGTGWYECAARKDGGRWRLSKRITHVDGVPLYWETDAYAQGKRWDYRGGQWVLENA